MTKIASVTTILEAKFTRHKKGQTCVLFKGHLLYLYFVNLFKKRKYEKTTKKFIGILRPSLFFTKKS